MKQKLRFKMVLGWLAILKNSELKLKYATFEGIFYIFMYKTNEKINFLYLAASKIEKLHNKKVRKS